MLSLAEQIFLLSLDEETGHSFPLPEKAMELALAGALLMALVQSGRLEVQDETVEVIETQRTQDPLLDGVLADLEAHSDLTLSDCLRRVTGHAHLIQHAVCQRLIDKKIITRLEDRFLWVLADERFPILDHQEEREVRQRIREVVLQGRTPSAQDVAIISLVEACDLTHTILSETELTQFHARLKELDQLDPIGIAIIQAIASADHALHDSGHIAI